MLYYQLPMYFFAGAMCYLFPDILKCLMAIYVIRWCLSRP